MKRKIFILFLLALIIFAIPNLTFGQFGYARVFRGDGDEGAYAIAEGVDPKTQLRTYVLAGYRDSFPLVIGVKAYNATFRWGFTAQWYGVFLSAVNADDGFVVAGWRGTGRYPILVKISFDGDFLWGRIFASESTVPRSIIRTSDKGYAICGWSYRWIGEAVPNAFVWKLDSLFRFEWGNYYYFPSYIAGEDVALSIAEILNRPQVRYIVVGRTQVRSEYKTEPFVMALNSTGRPIWARVLQGNYYDGEIRSVVAYEEKIAFVGTYRDSLLQSYPFFCCLHADNGSLLSKTGYSEHFSARCLTLHNPSSLYPYRFLISGYTPKSASEYGCDFRYLALYENGQVLWTRRHPSFANGYPHEEKAYAAIFSCGLIVIAGVSDNDVFTIKEDVHLLRTAGNGLNPVCTARDTVNSIPFPYNFVPEGCTSRIFHDPGYQTFSMDAISMPGFGLCFTLPKKYFYSVPIPNLFIKVVKSGGGIAALGNSLYLLVGNNTNYFGKFNLEDYVWSKVESIPPGPRGKKVKKGACMLAIPGKNEEEPGDIYLLKGSGTNEFYKYTPDKGWQTLPEPGFVKGVKGGFMAEVTVNDCTYIYAGSGYKNEWKRFNLQTGQWERCVPETLPGGKWKIGSAMTKYYGPGGDFSRIIMMRAGGKENSIFMFDPQSGFSRMASLPLMGRGTKRKKVGEGGSIKTMDGQSEQMSEGVEPTPWVFAIKGKNTRELWKLELSFNQGDTGRWIQLEDVPSQKGIKGGGCVAYSPWDMAIYITIGNNTNEIFAYYPTTEESLFSSFPKEISTMGKPDKSYRIINISNPTKDLSIVYYNLPKNEKATLKIYNALGEIVYHSVSDNGQFKIKKLPAGIYLLRFETKSHKEDRKLIIVK